MFKLMHQAGCLIALSCSILAWAGPVETTEQAGKVAEEWIKTSGIVGVRVQDMRSSQLLFIAGLHEANDPEVHANQLLIRKEDGFAALVFPAHDNPAASPAQRLGMEGLTGMAGMSGTRRTQQQMGKGARPAPIRNIRDARRRLDAWLKMNGLHIMQSGKVTAIEGIYVAELQDRDKKLANEAVLRRVDGYITLVKPVKLPEMTFPSIARK